MKKALFFAMCVTLAIIVSIGYAAKPRNQVILTQCSDSVPTSETCEPSENAVSLDPKEAEAKEDELCDSRLVFVRHVERRMERFVSREPGNRSAFFGWSRDVSRNVERLPADVCLRTREVERSRIREVERNRIRLLRPSTFRPTPSPRVDVRVSVR